MTIVTSSFSKSSIFKFARFEERLLKASFSLRISVDGWPNPKNKASYFKFLEHSVDATLL